MHGPWQCTFLNRVQKHLRCTFLHTVCTWDTRTPAIKNWPSTTRIFNSWTLYYIALTLQYTILSCTSFSIPQKTCISRPYCMRYFGLNYQYPFWYGESLVHVFNYSTIISKKQQLSITSTSPNIYLVLEFEFGLQRNRYLAFECP